DDGILVVNPLGPLAIVDFEALAAAVDPYIEAEGELKGLLVDAGAFPGWEDFGAMLTHLKFVRSHHHAIRRVALVSDSQFLSVVPKLVDHFVSAEVRHFDHEDRTRALAWLREEDALA
ncbi:MAG: STAS/SEC14 domain-containing protein, partial [Pseudomonadota bacterium]